MLIPTNVLGPVSDTPPASLVKSYDLYHSLYGGTMGQIQRLTTPSTAGGVSAIGARVEQVAAAPTGHHNPDARQQRERQLVYSPIEGRVLHDDGVMRVATVAGFGWYYV